jgi:hypothetical protein
VRNAVLFVVMLIALSGCSVVPVFTMVGTDNLPPILTSDELTRSYRKIGRIHVTRTVYWVDYAIPPNLHEWGLDALRLEARKLDADAVILPEITSREAHVFIFPSFPATEYKATGVAIKFGR